MRRDAGAELGGAGVEVDAVEALVPVQQRLARQQLGRRLDARLRGRARRGAPRELAASSGAQRSRGRASGAAASARATTRRDLGGEAARRRAPGDQRLADRLGHRREARRDVPPRRLVGHARVAQRLDELAGQPGLVVEEGLGRGRLPGEEARAVGRLARGVELALARQGRRGAAGAARRSAGGRRLMAEGRS